MRIGYFGDGDWARQALDRISEATGLQAVYVVARHDAPDQGLRARSESLGVPFFSPEDVNRAAFLEELAEYEPELNVSMSYDQILKAEAIEMAPKGFINCHAGALPFYRGRSVLNWALINGEQRFGVTVHDVDTGIDTGDILVQQFGAIAPDDDYASLLDKAATLCADALLEAIERIREGTVSRTPQEDIHPVGFYCSGRGEGDEWIDWSWPSKRVHDFVRAIAPPGPGARTLLDGEPVVVLSSETIPQVPEYIDRPGTVVGREDDGIVVKTGDTALKVTEVADWHGEVRNPRTPTYQIGTSFGINLHEEIGMLRRKVARMEERIERLEKK